MKNYWNLKLSKWAALGSAALVSMATAQAQLNQPETSKNNTQEQYLYPIYPGKPGSLAGTMGELRQTHFHSGIDIRTNNQTGHPVLASKSGYISRASMFPSSYGNIIYITHPDGNTTLYAHLDEFKGALAKHVLREQYTRKTFEIDLTFAPDQFKVKQGDTIALSGNTGSSGGPHLHFDIRDANFLALDPLKVAAFPEIKDNLPPAAEKVALVTLDKNARINDRFGRFEFNAAMHGASAYTIASPLLASGTIGLQIIAKDRLAEKSPFFGSVNYIEVRRDGQLVFSQAIDKIDVTETRAIYMLMDFKTMRNKGSRFYKLYVDDGNPLKFYGQSPGKGMLQVKPGDTSDIEITLKDSYGNSSKVTFKLMGSPPVKQVPTLEAMTTDISSEVSDNTLVVSARACTDTAKARVYSRGEVRDVAPDYGNHLRTVYLIDLRATLPDSVVVCGKSITTRMVQRIPAGTEYKYYSDVMEVVFPEQALYDTTYFRSHYYRMAGGNEVFLVGDRNVPLNKNIQVTLIPKVTYNWTPATAVYRLVGKGYSYVGGEYVNGRIQFGTREFGEFTVLKDEEPPSIKMVNADRVSARFKIRDNLSGIARFDANINGEWLLMHYDSKTSTIWSEKLDKQKPLKGKLELVVTDNAGNKSTFTKQIL